MLFAFVFAFGWVSFVATILRRTKEVIFQQFALLITFNHFNTVFGFDLLSSRKLVEHTDFQWAGSGNVHNCLRLFLGAHIANFLLFLEMVCPLQRATPSTLPFFVLFVFSLSFSLIKGLAVILSP